MGERSLKLKITFKEKGGFQHQKDPKWPLI